MKMFLLFSIWFLSVGVVAQEKILVPQLQSYMRLITETFYFDGSGKRLLYKTPYTSNSKFYGSGKAKFQVWNQIQTDAGNISRAMLVDAVYNANGSMDFDIQLAEKIAGSVGEEKFTGFIRREKMTLENLNPVSVVIYSSPELRVVVRITPTLDVDDIPAEVDFLPFNGDQATIYDNKGRLWAKDFGVEGKYVSLESPALGGFFVLSFYPFKGGAVVGSARGTTMQVDFGNDLKLTLQKKQPFTPFRKSVKVYGRFTKSKTGRGTSDITYYSNSEDELAKFFDQRWNKNWFK